MCVCVCVLCALRSCQMDAIKADRYTVNNNHNHKLPTHVLICACSVCYEGEVVLYSTHSSGISRLACCLTIYVCVCVSLYFSCNCWYSSLMFFCCGSYSAANALEATTTAAYTSQPVAVRRRRWCVYKGNSITWRALDSCLGCAVGGRGFVGRCASRMQLYRSAEIAGEPCSACSEHAAQISVNQFGIRALLNL